MLRMVREEGARDATRATRCFIPSLIPPPPLPTYHQALDLMVGIDSEGSPSVIWGLSNLDPVSGMVPLWRAAARGRGIIRVLTPPHPSLDNTESEEEHSGLGYDAAASSNSAEFAEAYAMEYADGRRSS